MNPPRYTVGSVTGYPINPAAQHTDQRAATIWYVHDRLNGYAIVREFREGGRGHGAETKARLMAAAMNLEHDNGDVPFARCRNGHLLDAANLYTRPNGKRECRLCVTGRTARQTANRKARAA